MRSAAARPNDIRSVQLMPWGSHSRTKGLAAALGKMYTVVVVRPGQPTRAIEMDARHEYLRVFDTELRDKRNHVAGARIVVDDGGVPGVYAWRRTLSDDGGGYWFAPELTTQGARTAWWEAVDQYVRERA